MNIVRFSAGGKAKYGVLEGNVVRGFRGNPYSTLEGRRGSFKPDGSTYDLSEVKLLAPCLPSKVICLGLNYHSHARELKSPPPPVPLLFLKPSTAVIGPEAEIVMPGVSVRVDYEGELAVVIGREAKDVPENRAEEYVFGYTCLNDVTERHYQKEDGQWTRAKGFDTFAPIGPWITTGISANDLKLETYLNGEVRQSGRTSDLIFGVAEIISFISGIMTLLPGDVISTGTPSGIGPVKPGDVVEIVIEKIGTLRNPVVAAKV